MIHLLGVAPGDNMRINLRLKGVVLRVLVFAGALLVGITAYLYFSRSDPIVYRYGIKGNPVNEPEFTIFNPFRDRSPESTAAAFLEQMRAGNCPEAVAVLSQTPDYNQELCEKESDSPLTGWRLKNRSDDAAKVRMYYRAHRKNYQGYQGQLWVTVERRGSNWQVSKYECFY